MFTMNSVSLLSKNMDSDVFETRSWIYLGSLLWTFQQLSNWETELF